jgi:glycosyltransferase involved in cell wall biosynthesis
MTRISTNPLKSSTSLVPPSPDISLCIVTHYRDEPYHRYRLPVVDLCIQSMRDGAQGKSYELLIWDNGSTDEFRKHLQTLRPDTLVLSPNVGKSSARLGLANIARGRIMAYSDDDILYFPGWLDAHMEILAHFPRPILAAGMPQRTAFNFGMGAVKRFAQAHADATLHTGRLISDEDERMFAMSIGREWEHHKRLTASFPDYMLEWQGMKAWAHGHHAQFVTYREDILLHLKPSKIHMDVERDWECALDDADYLRLTTYKRACVHIGNELSGNVIINGKEVNLAKMKA